MWLLALLIAQALILVPIANLIVGTGDPFTIALLVYTEMGFFNLVAGIMLGLSIDLDIKIDDWLPEGIGKGTGYAIVLWFVIDMSYHISRNGGYDLKGNPHYTNFIGFPVAFVCSWIGFLVTYHIARRRFERDAR